MDTVRQILSTQGVNRFEDLDVNERYQVEGGSAYMDLDIERVGEDQLMVGHFYTQRMDLMSDPEVVFDIEDYHDSRLGWTPVEYTQHGVPQVYEHSEDGLGADVEGFVSDWNRNLDRQGFVDRAAAGRVKHSK
jgi:hypothetical protein